MIGEQIPSKRLWLGLINEPKTHIMGVSGVGAGMRKELQELQIELALPHEGLDETLRDQRARVVDPKEKRECSGLTRVIEVLKPDKFVIVPIVALGNTIGIVAIEPVLQHDTYLTRLIPLLTRVCQELGAVLHARLLEKRVTDADKMKMAGHFAGAVGHFFNNMLQVVIGQASLISVQVPRGTMADSAAQMIVDVANKGAELTKQLSYLTTFQTNEKESITYAGLYESTKKLLSKIWCC